MYLAIIFIVIAGLFVLSAVLYRVLNSPKAKGRRGERTVAKILGETVPGRQYIINDLMFTEKNGNSRQIDHILILPSGIWVVETKNYSGRIYGNEQQREWTQVLAFGRRKNKFYNPVKQNTTHIYSLSDYLHTDRAIFQNVVVFLAQADISYIQSNAVYTARTLQKIKSAETGIRLPAEEMQNYYERLSALKGNSTITQKEHIEHIHKMQDDIKKGVCPRCGGKLVIRNGKNGQFLGCSNYPRCKFTKNID